MAASQWDVLFCQKLQRWFPAVYFYFFIIALCLYLFLPLSPVRWCLQRRETDQPEADCNRGSGEVPGKVAPAYKAYTFPDFSNHPYLHWLQLVMEVSPWNMSHCTHRRTHTEQSADIRDVKESYSKAFTLTRLPGNMEHLYQGSPSCSSAIATWLRGMLAEKQSMLGRIMGVSGVQMWLKVTLRPYVKKIILCQIFIPTLTPVVITIKSQYLLYLLKLLLWWY